MAKTKSLDANTMGLTWHARLQAIMTKIELLCIYLSSTLRRMVAGITPNK
jgi:hypothetical protein